VNCGGHEVAMEPDNVPICCSLLIRWIIFCSVERGKVEMPSVSGVDCVKEVAEQCNSGIIIQP